MKRAIFAASLIPIFCLSILNFGCNIQRDKKSLPDDKDSSSILDEDTDKKSDTGDKEIPPSDDDDNDDSPIGKDASVDASNDDDYYDVDIDDDDNPVVSDCGPEGICWPLYESRPCPNGYERPPGLPVDCVDEKGAQGNCCFYMATDSGHPDVPEEKYCWDLGGVCVMADEGCPKGYYFTGDDGLCPTGAIRYCCLPGEGYHDPSCAAVGGECVIAPAHRTCPEGMFSPLPLNTEVCHRITSGIDLTCCSPLGATGSPCEKETDCNRDGKYGYCLGDFQFSEEGYCTVNCLDSSECGEFAICGGITMSAMTMCVIPCNSDKQCREGLTCEAMPAIPDNGSKYQYICWDSTTYKKLGESCKQDGDCLSLLCKGGGGGKFCASECRGAMPPCPEGYRCNDDNICVKR